MTQLERGLEILIKEPFRHSAPKAVLFDFDGTISTLRQGWEAIMRSFMIEMISGGSIIGDATVKEVDDYIEASTGIQTIHQMIWLTDAVKRFGNRNNIAENPWIYKAEYNRRLMEEVETRKKLLSSGLLHQSDFLISGSEPLLSILTKKNVHLYVASGTDDPDVKEEARVLGISKYFTEITGAPIGKIDCSKEMVLKKLISEKQLQGPEVVVIGDGKVEISLAKEVGAIPLGVASDEIKRSGINSAKRERLINAGALAIVDCFEQIDEILMWLGLF